MQKLGWASSRGVIVAIYTEQGARHSSEQVLHARTRKLYEIAEQTRGFLVLDFWLTTFGISVPQHHARYIIVRILATAGPESSRNQDQDNYKTS